MSDLGQQGGSQLAVFEVRLEAVDKQTDRRRWNGGPLASSEANEALKRAVEAFQASISADGFPITRTGYGVTAREIVLLDRYVLDSDAPGPCPVRIAEPSRHYGVLDRRLGQHAILPDATLCRGMTIDRALDCLNELRGGLRAERSE